MRRWRVALLVATIAAAALSCGGSPEPSADEARVCRAVQTIVDEIGAGRAEGALETLPELEDAVNETTNERMSAAGVAFFQELFTDIDYTQLTIDQTAKLGQYYQKALAEHLAEIVNSCDDAGARVERLPQT